VDDSSEQWLGQSKFSGGIVMEASIVLLKMIGGDGWDDGWVNLR